MGTEGIRDRYINPYTDFGFKKLFGTDMNKELLISFLNALLEGKEEIDFRDWHSVITTAEKKGKEEGRKEGLAEGMEKGMEKGQCEERIKNARNLKRLGVSPDVIAQATGLTTEEIARL